MATLNVPEAAPLTFTTAWARCGTDSQVGTAYCYASVNPSEDAATIKASGVTGSSEGTAKWIFDVVGLSLGNWYMHFVQDDGADSNVVSTGIINFVDDSPTTDGHTFSRINQVATGTNSSSAKAWDYAVSGDVMYMAASSIGVAVYDISDPTTPTYVTTLPLNLENGTPATMETTDVLVFGNTLFACGRKIDFTVSNDSGVCAAYDITNPLAPSWISSFQPPSVPILTPNGQYSNTWYQGMAIEPTGTYLFMASQRYGLSVLDVSDPSLITEHTQYTSDDYIADTGAAADWLWETSRVAYGPDILGNAWVFCATHGDGVIALNVTDLGTSGSPLKPVNPQTYTYNADGMYGAPNVRLRSRNVVYDNYRIYVCSNIGNAVDRVERGLTVLNVSDPTTVGDWAHAPIGLADNDIWIDAGDQPDMGVFKFENYVYIAHGQRGTACFDVSVPSAPKYIGLKGTNMAASTNLYMTYLFRRLGVLYAYYSDSFNGLARDNSIYIDRVSGGNNMAFVIGNNTTSDPAGYVGQSVLNTVSRSSDCVLALYSAVAGDFVSSFGGEFEIEAGDRTYKVALYETDGLVPTNLVQEFPTTLSVLTSDGSAGDYVVKSDTISPTVPLESGKSYCVCILGTTGASGSIATDSIQTARVSRDVPVVAGEFDAVWSESFSSGNRSLHLWAAGDNRGGGIAGQFKKENYVETWTTSTASVEYLLKTGGVRGHRLFNAMAPYGQTTSTAPLSKAQMAQTYDIPDLAAVDAIMEAGGLYGAPFLLRLGYSNGSPAALVVVDELPLSDFKTALYCTGMFAAGTTATVTITYGPTPTQTAFVYVAPKDMNPEEFADGLANKIAAADLVATSFFDVAVGFSSKYAVTIDSAIIS